MAGRSPRPRTRAARRAIAGVALPRPIFLVLALVPLVAAFGAESYLLGLSPA